MTDLALPSSRRKGWAAVLAWTVRSALFHAGWLAQGQLGMALSWSWFGGLGGVALWWLLLAMWARAARPPTPVMRWAAAGSAAVGMAVAVLQGPTVSGWLGWGLNLLAWSWLCSRQGAWQLPRCAAGWLGSCAGVLLAVTLAADTASWEQRWPLLAGLLLLSLRLRPMRMNGHASRMDLPMGLMMGSLLPMAQWCSAAGWSPWNSVALHLAAMVAGLALSQALGRQGWRAPALACATAAVLGLGEAEWAMLAAAALAACASAWAQDGRQAVNTPAWAGALGLLLVGALAPFWGPDALRLVLVPALALAAFFQAWRARPALLARGA